MSDYVIIDEHHYFDYYSLELLDSFKSYLRDNHNEYENLISFMFQGAYAMSDGEDDFLNGNIRTPDEMYHTRFWNIFRRFLRIEVGHCNYTFVLHFMCHVFENKHMYDIQKLHEVLKSIIFKDGSVNLADFCAGFYIFLEETEAQIDEFRSVETHTIEELYDPQITIKRELLLANIWDTLPKYIYMQFYGYTQKEVLTPEDIDGIAAFASETKQLPGLLFPLFCYFYKNSKWIDGMYDILEKYVFDYYQSYDWNLDSKNAGIQANTIINYFEWLWACLHDGEYNQRMELLSQSDKYDKMAFLYDSRNEYKKNMFTGEGFWTDFGKLRYGERRKLWLQFVSVIDKGSSIIQKHARKGIKYTISYITAITPYILCSIEEYDKAIDFTINHYAEIDIEDRLSEEFRLTLSRLIFKTKNLEKATILYGYFVFDGSTHKRIADFQKDMVDVADCIEDTFNSIRSYKDSEHEYFTHKIQAELDFILAHENVGIVDTINTVRNYYTEGNIIPISVFRSLFRILESLNRSNEINLGRLGVPNIKGDDKWLYPITEDMIVNGIHEIIQKREKHLKRFEEYRSVIKSNELEQVCKPVTYLMQDHLSVLVEQQLQEALQNIKYIKDTFTGINQEDDFEQIKRLDDSINRITKTIVSSQDFSFFRHRLMSNIREFCEKYINNDEDILGHLPDVQREEIISYLCTSTAMYEYLSTFDGEHSEPDYSAVLLPLTKAIEYILNYLFDRMNCRVYRNENIFGQTVSLRSATRGFLFEKDGESNNYRKSNKLEFGKYLRILIDYDDIVITSHEGTVTLQGKGEQESGPDYRFEIWNGSNVLDVSKLRLFSEIEFEVCQKISDKPEEYARYTMAFSETNDDYNRKLLYKALDYVRLNYRNPCAHKDPISKVTADECMALFFQLEWLIWILIYIIIPE